jgi:hypothetical protein
VSRYLLENPKGQREGPALFWSAIAPSQGHRDTYLGPPRWRGGQARGDPSVATTVSRSASASAKPLLKLPSFARLGAGIPDARGVATARQVGGQAAGAPAP